MTPGGVKEMRDGVATGRVTAVAQCERALDDLARFGATLGAVVTLAGDRALARAAAIDADPALRALPLAGVPIAVKDNICTQGVRTTAGSRALADFTPPYDATVVARLEAAGAVIVAKTNCDEFAMGSSNENSAHGRRATRGRSTGRPAGRAAGRRPSWPRAWCRLALGSDTGGSVGSRRPSAAWWVSSRPTGACRATASSRSARRSTRSGRSRARPPMRRCCCR
jgi:aspartyl-tRNA(Asn)/glutamyl-tRNA(Gln) amidotransferase subunit A